MLRQRIFSHVDLRVKDRKRAIQFYDALFESFGLKRESGEHWTTYNRIPEGVDPTGDWTADEWLGFTEDAHGVPGASRIALEAGSRNEVDRLGAILTTIGAKNIEGPEYAYGPNYYAVFFEDPDGNRLEICYCT